MPLKIMPRKNADIIADRARLLGPNVSTFYQEPVHLVKGAGVWVWDADDRKYLDCYNNVPHVGHCHPKVVEAICRQSATLNTHTRYLQEGIVRNLERLTASFENPLSTGLLTCTGSEANNNKSYFVSGNLGHKPLCLHQTGERCFNSTDGFFECR